VCDEDAAHLRARPNVSRYAAVNGIERHLRNDNGRDCL
jgi:hypothetical protein